MGCDDTLDGLIFYYAARSEYDAEEARIISPRGCFRGQPACWPNVALSLSRAIFNKKSVHFTPPL